MRINENDQKSMKIKCLVIFIDFQYFFIENQEINHNTTIEQINTDPHIGNEIRTMGLAVEMNIIRPSESDMTVVKTYIVIFFK